MSSEVNGSASPDSESVEQIQAEIARTREELAHTVNELTARLDVKTRVQERIHEVQAQAAARARDVRDRATGDDGRPTPAALGVGGAVVAVLATTLVVVIWRRAR